MIDRTSEASFLKEATVIESDQDFSQEEKDVEDNCMEELRCALALSLTMHIAVVPYCKLFSARRLFKEK
jgi:hypothetical protein